MIFIQWHIGDWSTATRLLSPTEKGVYLDLLMQYYEQEAPLMPEECDRISRAYAPEEQKALQYVLTKFFTMKDGRYHNTRADSEINEYLTRCEKARKAAKRRWNKASEDAGDARQDAQPMLGACNRINGASATDDAQAVPERCITNNHNPITNTITTTSTDVDVVTPPALDALHSPDLFEQDSSETSGIVELDNDGVPVDPPKTKKRRGGESAALLFCEAIKSFPDEWRSYIADVRPDLDPEKIFAEFSFYWTVGKGKDKRRTVKGWSSTWQTWIRRQEEPRQAYKPAPMPKRSNPILRTAEEFAAIDYHQGINPDGSF